MTNISGIFSALRSRVPSTSPKKVISIHIGRNSLKAVVVRRDRKRLVIVSAAQVETDTEATYDLNKIGRALSNLLNELGSYPKDGIIVTDQVKFLASELPIPPGKKLPEERLAAAVAWEMEPYIDFVVQEGLFAYRLQQDRTRTDNTPVLISAMGKSEFEAISEILKDFRISLSHAYSPDGAFAFASEVRGDAENRIVISCQHSAITALFLSTTSEAFVLKAIPVEPGFHIAVIETIPVEPGVPLDQQIKRVVHELTGSIGEAKEVVVAGDLASEELIDQLKAELSTEVTIWKPEENLKGFGITLETGDMGPAYAAAMGAAVQELGLVGRPLGVTDKIPLIKRVRERVHLAPAVALATVILCFIGHYAFVKSRIGHYTSEVKELEQKKKVFTRLRDERTRLTSRQKDIAGKKRYLENLPERQKNLVLLLSGIPDLLPDTMVLENIIQEDATSFSIAGSALQASSIGLFANQLSRLEAGKQVTVKAITKQDESKEKGRLPYGFSVELTLKE
ncbi:MAG: hypothetical protein JRJ42_09150 [Deltaproteobacteria bacterium]|nr:hypothetical protein [Deltaproteobacteria bacterium]